MVERLGAHHPEQKAPPSRAERIDMLSEQIEELEREITELNAENEGSNTHSEQIGRLKETLHATTQEFESLCAAEEAGLDITLPPPKRSSQESTNPDQRKFAEKVGQFPHFTAKDMKEEDGKGRTFDSGKPLTD